MPASKDKHPPSSCRRPATTPRIGWRRIAFFYLLVPLSVSVSHADKKLLKSYKQDIEPILDYYCYDCHGYGSSKGGVTLDEFDAQTIGDHDLWMRILRNTRSHIMPPKEEDLPTAEERASLLEWIKSKPFRIDPDNPDPGHLTVQRLNRIEYQNTIFDLTGITFDARDAFPPDTIGEGFDNIGELLTLSPMMLEKYLDAANRIISESVPNRARVLPTHTLSGTELVELFSSAPKADQSNEFLQLSFYEPSTRSANYKIEEAGKYQIVLDLKPIGFSRFRGFDYNRCKLVFRIDGQKKIDQEFESLDGKTFRFAFDYDWEPGNHSFSFDIEPLTSGLEKIKDLKMRVQELKIKGPHAIEKWVRPANYERFFPGGVPEEKTEREAYTRKLISDFATRAFRRPADSQTIERLAQLANQVSSQEGFTYEMGISQAMVAILASPRFLFREEESLPNPAKGEHPLIDEYSLASRLSYFFWSTMPDEELFSLAEAGKLRQNLDDQIQRMMKDPRSENFINNFAGQWLHARDIESVNISRIAVWLRDHPDPEILAAKKEYEVVREIPEVRRTPEQHATYNRTRKVMVGLYQKDLPQLKWREQRAMKEETEMYFEHVIREDRSLTELLDSNYTFLNDTLAEHYGIDGIEGRELRKVTLEPGSPRGGVLTQGTILSYTSNPTRTSPVKRGVFILENILGTPPAAPPPNIPALEDIANPDELESMSLRDTLALHREQKLCASCHNRMDPLGLAFENFNAMGIWRDSELNQPIDVSGELVTGESFSSIQEMKRILATDRVQDFYYCLSEKLLTYALGRGIEYHDTETLDQLVDVLKQTNGQPSALLRAIVHSVPFQKRRHSEFNPD